MFDNKCANSFQKTYCFCKNILPLPCRLKNMNFRDISVTIKSLEIKDYFT